MKTILSSRRDRYLTKFSIFLITLALIAGMVGCGTEDFKCDLTIAITEGGTVVRPGEGTFSYYKGAPVKLTVQAEKGYKFVEWTGDVDTIDDVNEATTTITMNGDYSITANFALEILEIWDWGDLDAIRKNLSATYILMNNLDYTTANYTELAGPTANGGDGWEPIGTRNDPFDGSFAGNGCEIRDLFINCDERYTGLFGYVDNGGVVKDIGVVNATVTGKDNVGGLVAMNDGTVSNSYSTGSVKGDDSVGGLVGDNGGTVEYSYSTGNVTSEEGSYIGGLVGINDGGTVSDSYSTGSVRGKSYVGGLVGCNDEESTVSNSHFIGNVTSEEGSYVGGLVGCNDEESTVSNSYSTGSVTGHVNVGGLIGFNDKSTVSNSHYNYDEVFVNGENIITIGALNQTDFDEWLADDKLLDVNERLYQENGYYVVKNVTDFKELLAFGQNSTLEFRLTNDLDLGNEPNFYIPYFAGQFDGNGHKISNLSLNLTFASNIGLFGYLAGDREITGVGVENVTITGASSVGGLVGANWEGTVRRSYSTGSVTGNQYVGGLVGCNYGESTVEDSYSASNVFGGKHVGGLVGYNKHEVSNSTFTGSVNGTEDVGGLVGSNGGPVSESYSTGSVTGYTSVGGLVGFNEVDYVSFSSSNCTVEGSYDVGGLVGYNKGGTVSNSYSTGSVSGERRVGGLVGRNEYIDINKEGKVNSSYSTGNVSGDGDNDIGGLVGQNIDGSVTRSFWNIETSGQATSAGGTGKYTAEMKSKATFQNEGWSIFAVASGQPPNDAYTWNIVNGVDYPFLSWQSI
jgi:hypothetical protein